VSLQSHLSCVTELIFRVLGTDLVAHSNHKKKRLKVYDALLEMSLIFLTMLALRQWTHVDHIELLWSRSNLVH
jgi:hypothetical protein